MLNIKQKICITSGTFIIILVLLVFGIVRPLILEIKNMSELVKEKNQKLLVLEKTDRGHLEEIESHYNEIKENVDLIKSSFLEENKTVDFFVSLEGIASSTSNELEIKVKEFPTFNLNLVGTFPNLLRFIGWLENGKYSIGVNYLKVNKFIQRGQLGAGSAGLIETNIEIEARPSSQYID